MSRKPRITFPRMDVELADRAALPKRRGEVLELAARGMQSKEIARAMGISVDTVDWHLNELKDQLCAFSRADLISQGWMHGLFRARALALLLMALSVVPVMRSRPSPINGTRPPAVRHTIGRTAIREIRA
ncbi:hypothetical protein BKP64_10815 [Marinobacter salinus]|uniref:HTH luxR-type domain-containing protein n=1 Tax=Marinobacter salinus TaxID=1874317 RepID=A0A1D9GLZ5_9GAMM|nr:helix-turn-helix transcriptional regulator [Marinobacter salinus]AOY88619.1 hypothetical protein BKP64_10815 [Marinobacter salinus]